MTFGPVKVIGDATLVAKTAGRAATLSREMGALVAYWGAILNTTIKAKASGRPGPNAPTGDYRRSWVHTFTNTIGGGTSTNGTNKPQARRLEFGFTGTDSIGRSYDQPPYPHVGPAKDAVEPKFVKAGEALARSIK
jgi:hypothetical protein